MTLWAFRSRTTLWAGWAKCTICVDDACATVTAAYLSTHGKISRQQSRPRCGGIRTRRPGFKEEPGEHRWIFEPVSEGRVNVRILEFKEMWGGRPDEDGAVIFHAQCRLRTLAGAVLSELQRLERTYGLARYRQKWVEHDFPAAVGRVAGATY